MSALQTRAPCLHRRTATRTRWPPMSQPPATSGSPSTCALHRRTGGAMSMYRETTLFCHSNPRMRAIPARANDTPERNRPATAIHIRTRSPVQTPYATTRCEALPVGIFRRAASSASMSACIGRSKASGRPIMGWGKARRVACSIGRPGRRGRFRSNEYNPDSRGRNTRNSRGPVSGMFGGRRRKAV